MWLFTLCITLLTILYIMEIIYWKKGYSKWSIIRLQHVDNGELNLCILKASVDITICLTQYITGYNNMLHSVICWSPFSFLTCVMFYYSKRLICLPNMQNAVSWPLLDSGIYAQRKKLSTRMVFLKWQTIRQASRDYWPDNLKNAMVTWQDITLAVRNHQQKNQEKC